MNAEHICAALYYVFRDYVQIKHQQGRLNAKAATAPPIKSCISNLSACDVQLHTCSAPNYT